MSKVLESQICDFEQGPLGSDGDERRQWAFGGGEVVDGVEGDERFRLASQRAEQERPRKEERATSTGGSDASLQVADLIDQHRQWDITAISANFGPANFDRILAIPLSLYPTEDILIWNGTTSGCYTVKSDVWRQSLLGFNFTMAASTTSTDFLLYVSANTSSTEFERFLVICWSIWFERNAEYHDKPSKKAAAVLDFATNYLLKYQTAQASSLHNTEAN
ncbi:hypothetical protein G4B88_022949 [Cannabis sativa]|uniref:Uncharacterized protein n=1 Tax=Cannabis sativa TaxID=3483 RepID=A0A7J6G581_CANSA|nr:hypothetical protein G4B88_022949 [Cannabis sativa]